MPRPSRGATLDPEEDALDTRHLNTWIELSESAYAHNLRFFRQRVGPDVELSAVVKANAYGHGWREMAPLALRHGADSFCVHSLEEALLLREAGFDEEILVLGHVPLARLEEAVAANLRLVLYNRASAERLAEIAARRGERARVHLKLETGTHRQGIDDEELGWFLDFLGATSSVRLDGAYTHFANVEDTTSHEYADGQLEQFREMAARIEATPGLDLDRDRFRLHTGSSAAIVLFERTHFGMARMGLGQYGLWPSNETFLSYMVSQGQLLPEASRHEILRPVLTWKARVSQVKTIPAGAAVSYGCTYRTTRETRIAILPVGYSDGYDRGLSNQAHVLVRGRRAPVRGRVCMNLTVVDVTDVPDARLEDEVVLLGAQGDDRVSADDLAAWTGTINYEIVARLDPAIPRLVVD